MTMLKDNLAVAIDEFMNSALQAEGKRELSAKFGGRLEADVKQH